MDIVAKMVDHINNILGTIPFTYIDSTGKYAHNYKSLQDYIIQSDNFWYNLNQIETNKYSAAKLLTSFIEDEENYELFLTQYSKLKLSANKYDAQFIPNYIKNKEKLVHFLQHTNLAIDNNSYYVKPHILKEVIESLCISSVEDNEKIIKNLLITNKKLYSTSKIKIALEKILYDKFGNEAEKFYPYYKKESNTEDLIIQLDDSKIICSLLDKKHLIAQYTLKTATDTKDYLKMLKDIANVIKKEFKLTDLKVTEYNPNAYSVISIVQKDFEYDLDSLWSPMVKQYITVSNDKEQLTKFLKTLLLYQSIDDKIPAKQEDKKVIKKLKI